MNQRNSRLAAQRAKVISWKMDEDGCRLVNKPTGDNVVLLHLDPEYGIDGNESRKARANGKRMFQKFPTRLKTR